MSSFSIPNFSVHNDQRLSDLSVSGQTNLLPPTPTPALETKGIGIVDSNGHLVNLGPTPTIVLGPGAGNGAFVTNTGSDTAGRITLSAGVAPQGSSIIFTMTFASPFVGRDPICQISLPTFNSVSLQTNPNTFVTFVSTRTALLASSALNGITQGQTYVWDYQNLA